MVGRATMAVGTEVGVTTEKPQNPGVATESHAPLGLPWRGIEFAETDADCTPKVHSALDTVRLDVSGVSASGMPQAAVSITISTSFAILSRVRSPEFEI